MLRFLPNGPQYFLALAGKLQQLRIQFHQIGVEPIVSGAPLRARLRRAHAQNRKISMLSVFPQCFADIRELVADIGRVSRRDQVFAVGKGNDGPQHTLVLGVRLAEVKVRHNSFIIGRSAININGT